MSFLHTSVGTIFGGACAQKIVAIGIPKYVTKVPLCIADPMHMESCLLVLAAYDVTTNTYLVCPGANKEYPERLVENSHFFYTEGIRTIVLHKEQLVPLRDPDNSAPKTMQDVNNRHALKLIITRAKCIAEIHHAELEDRQANVHEFIDEQVSTWPFERNVPGMKMLVVWEGMDSRRHVSICPCIKDLVRYCSGAKSVVSTTEHTSNLSSIDPSITNIAA